MKRILLDLAFIFGALAAIAGAAWAAHTGLGALLGDYTHEGGLVTAVSSSTAAATACDGDKTLYDKHGGGRGCTGTTDAARAATQTSGRGAAPVATGATNTDGGVLRLVGGMPTHAGAVTKANFQAGDTVSIALNNAAATVKFTEDTDGDCSGAASEQACAVLIAATIDSMTGIDSCAGAACTRFTGTAGTFYVYLDETEGAAWDAVISVSRSNTVTLTQGQRGAVVVDSALTFGSTTSMEPTGTTQTVDWSLGNIQFLDLESASGNVTVTMSNQVANGTYILYVRQDGGGGARTVTITGALWESGVAPVQTVTNDAVDSYICDYIGTSNYCYHGVDLR